MIWYILIIFAALELLWRVWGDRRGIVVPLLRACGLALGRVAQGAASSASTEVPEKVALLLRQIDEGELASYEFNEFQISSCWVKLPNERSIYARWYSSGQRSELRMKGKDIEWTELPTDQWSEMILRALIHKTRHYHVLKLSKLLE